MLKSLATRVLIALALGLGIGALIHAQSNPDWDAAARLVEAVGSLWLNALRMTVVPMIFALIVVGIATVLDTASTGRLAAKASLFFAAMLVLACTYVTLATPALFSLWPVDREAAQALVSRAGATASALPEAPSLIEWIKALVPTNPIQAAAEDAILPLIIFAVFFGFAATKLPSAPREQVVGFFRAIGDIMITIVRWVLVAAPLGVFGLSLGVGLNAGVGAVGVLAHYVVAVSCIIFAAVFLVYLVVLALRSRLLVRFAHAVLPVQVLALSTQSSLACLPAMIERSRDDLNLSERTTGLVLPLAVALFRFTSPIGNLAVAFFLAHVYGVEPTAYQIIGAMFVAFAVSIGSVGLPGQVSFFASVGPIALTLGLPLELLPILLAVEVIPDMFRTIGNVTADVAAVTVLDESEKPSVAG